MESRFDLGLKVRREVLGVEHVARAQARTTPLDAEFQRFITPGDLTGGLARQGLAVQELRGLGRAPDGSGHRLLTDDLSVTYLGWARKG